MNSLRPLVRNFQSIVYKDSNVVVLSDGSVIENDVRNIVYVVDFDNDDGYFMSISHVPVGNFIALPKDVYFVKRMFRIFKFNIVSTDRGIILTRS